MDPKEENRIIVCKNKKMEIIVSIQVSLIPRMNFNYMEMVERKLFLPSPSINIVYPNEVKMIVVLITKIMEIITKYQSLFHSMVEL